MHYCLELQSVLAVRHDWFELKEDTERCVQCVDGSYLVIVICPLSDLRQPWRAIRPAK